MLPEQTRVNRQFPTNFLKQRSLFTPQQLEQLQSITWGYKLTADLLAIHPSDTVSEIHVFTMQVKSAMIKQDFFRSFDQAIPYATVYEVCYEGRKQYWMVNKETQTLKSPYYHTKWMKETDSFLTIEGETMEEVYRHFFHLITNGQVNETAEGTMADAIQQHQYAAKLQKRIDALTNKMKKEKQFNKQLELRQERQRLIAELEEQKL